MQINNSTSTPNFGKLIIDENIMANLSKRQRNTVKQWQAQHALKPNLTVKVCERESIQGLLKAYISINDKEVYSHIQHDNIFTDLGLFLRPFSYIKKMIRKGDEIEARYNARKHK